MFAIPATHYTSAERLAAEWDQVFAKCWLLAAHGSELAQAGTYRRMRIGRAEILLVRQKDGSVRAMHAVCQHRGHLLCPEDDAEGCGEVQTFRCPYHHWEYELDGRLRRAPRAGLSSAAMKRIALPQIKVEEYLGFVWVCFSASPEPLRDFLSAVSGGIAAYQPEALRLSNSTSVTVDANWKALVDVNNEGYHLGTLHPELACILDPAALTEAHLGPHSSTRIPLGTSHGAEAHEAVPKATAQALASMGVKEIPGQIGDIRDAIRRANAQALKACGLELSSGTPEESGSTERFVDLADKQQFTVFPNVQLNFTPLRLEIYRQWPDPDKPGRCVFEELTYLRPAHAPDRVHYRRGVHGELSLGTVLDADLAVATSLQRGMGSGAIESLRLTKREGCIAHFHRTLMAHMGESMVKSTDSESAEAPI